MPEALPATDQEYADHFKLMEEQTQSYLPEVLELMDLSPQAYAELFRARGEVYTVREADQAAGFYWIELRGRELHLHGIILKPDFQGHGLGSWILNKLERDYSEQADCIELGVHNSNEGAYRLYKRLGYQVVDERPELDFLIMRKALPN